VQIRVIRVRQRRVAWPAPQYTEKQMAEREERGGLPAEIDDLCHAWARWVSTRRYFGPPGRLDSIIGQLRSRTPRATDGMAGPNAPCSQELACFHQAVLAGGEGTDRIVFEVHYRYRPASIKRAADLLDISRAHWYYLRNRFAIAAFARHHVLVRQEVSKSSLP
jgi:hypothetical protein